MKIYFYIRVSTADQNTIRQEVMAKEHSIPIGNVYIEKMSGKNVTDRPVLLNLMAALKPGDKVIVESISRFARNTVDLITLVEQLNDKGVSFTSLKENIDTTTSQGIFMMTIFAAVAQLERSSIRERQAEGIKIAVAQGKYKGRTPIEYPKQWDKYYNMIQEKQISHVAVMKLLDLKKTTFYRLLRDYQENN